MIIRALLLFLVMAGSVAANPIRIKDLVEFDGVRGNIIRLTEIAFHHYKYDLHD